MSGNPEVVVPVRQEFKRPNRGLIGLLSKGLAPLPEAIPLYHPSAIALGMIRSYRLAAFMLCMGAIALLFTLAYSFPWMRISPATIIVEWLNGVFGEPWGNILGTIAIIVLIIMLSSYGGTSITAYQGKFWDRAAMLEEQWFRTGAEKWSVGQRAYAVVTFGLVHITNFIYPTASIIVVTLVGAVLMAVYLSAYNKTKDTMVATLHSTKLHATYNRFAILYLLGVIAVLLVASMVTPR